MLAMPTALLRMLQRWFARLPPGSQLRRRGLKRLGTLLWAAASREDYEVALLFYEPDVEIQVAAEVARSLGLAESYRGRQGFLDVWRDYRQDMAEMRVEPEQIIDLGDRVAVRVAVVAPGRSGDVAIRQTSGSIYYFSPRGLIARQEWYWTWEDALAALERRDSREARATLATARLPAAGRHVACARLQYPGAAQVIGVKHGALGWASDRARREPQPSE